MSCYLLQHLYHQSMLKKDAGQRLRRARYASERTLDDIAAEAGVSPTTVINIETGKTTPHGRTLFALCRVLELDPDELIESPEPEPEEATA